MCLCVENMLTLVQITTLFTNLSIDFSRALENKGQMFGANYRRHAQMINELFDYFARPMIVVNLSYLAEIAGNVRELRRVPPLGDAHREIFQNRLIICRGFLNLV